MDEITEPQLDAKIAAFWANHTPDPETGCWIWSLGVSGSGYGGVQWEGKKESPHRLAFILCNGPIEDGLKVRHCDRPLCFNPAHLLLGTHADNMADKVERGRQGYPSKPLTASERDAVTGLYALRKERPWFTQQFIADALGVSISTVKRVLMEQTA